MTENMDVKGPPLGDSDGPMDADRFREPINISYTPASPARQALSDASCAVALALIDAWAFECQRIAAIVGEGVVAKADAIDRLHQIASAYDIEHLLGLDRVAAIIAEAFAEPLASRGAA
jgi:hypothetical protein